MMTMMVSAPPLLGVLVLVTGVEAAALLVYRRVTGRGMPARELVAFLGAGLALLVAMWLAVARAPFAAFAAAMLAALALHLWMIAQRWQR